MLCAVITVDFHREIGAFKRFFKAFTTDQRDLAFFGGDNMTEKEIPKPDRAVLVGLIQKGESLEALEELNNRICVPQIPL